MRRLLVIGGWVLCVVCTYMLASCSKPPIVAEMVPQLPPDLPRTELSLEVDTVAGGEKTHPWFPPKIDGESYREATIIALRRSGMFGQVSDTVAGDYRLVVEILHREQSEDFISLLVRYSLIDTRSGSETWADNILTHGDRGEAFAGGTAFRVANEHASRRNLAELVAKLAVVLMRLPRR